MYDRAKRTINLTSREDLGPHLGPTSYDVNLEFEKCSTGGYAPFGSLEQRNTIFTLNRDQVPSPPAYSPKLPYKHIKGGSSMKNTEVRFDFSKSTVPGPGAHNVKSYWPGSEHDPCDLLMPYLFRPTKPKIPIRYVERTFPSIVATLDAHGYEAGLDGQLKPQSGQIQVCGSEIISSNPNPCQRYRGCKWSSWTEYRKTFCTPNDNPGPGTYFTTMDDEWIRLVIRGLQRNLINSKHVLNIPRFFEKHIQDTKHEVSVTSGKYGT
ncbi:Sperm-tail PG-rich repeat-containing protein 2 [Taenia solium]|eukprot:TsM_000127500 transcript=TsM_000127500 gene=TsM_000127500